MISVIVPIYGVEKYIERCAISLMEQTYKDIEFIFVNDCTNDKSIEKLQHVLCKYPQRNVVVINKARNEGLPQARKTGVIASHGEYVINFDSDDWVEKDCISKMYACALENNSDIVMADYFEEYADRQVIRQIPKVSNPISCINMMLRAQLHSGVWNKMIKRELILDVEFPKCNMHEDLVTMVQVFLNAKVISYVHEPFYHYNLSNASSLTQTGVSIQKTIGTFENLKILESILKKSPNSELYKLSFSNFVNTFKGSIMMKSETRKVNWLCELYPESKEFVFSECRLPLLRKCLLWGAMNGCLFPYKVVDLIRRVLR